MDDKNRILDSALWVFSCLIGLDVFPPISIVIKVIIFVLLGIVLLFVRSFINEPKRITVDNYNFENNEIIIYSRCKKKIAIGTLGVLRYSDYDNSFAVALGYFESQSGDIIDDKIVDTKLKITKVIDKERLDSIKNNQNNKKYFYMTNEVSFEDIDKFMK